MPDPFPLNETALQAAQEKAAAEFADDAYDRELISTYLREAGFEVESRYKTIRAKHGLTDGLSDPERRLVGPWLPVDTQSAAEETTRRVAHERAKGEVRAFSDPDAAVAYLQGRGPVDQVEEEK